MRTNVYYSDLKIFAGLAELLTRFSRMYKVEEYCKNFMVVSWKEASVGIGGIRTKNTMLMNPYSQAERLSSGKGIIIC